MPVRLTIYLRPGLKSLGRRALDVNDRMNRVVPIVRAASAVNTNVAIFVEISCGIDRQKRAQGCAQQAFVNLFPAKLGGSPENKDPIMPMLLGLVTTLSMLALGFFLGRIWQIRRELLSNQQRADDEIARERQLEKQLLKLQENRFISARRWA